MEKLTLNELSANKDWKKAVIVFKQESFDKEYSLESRSYSVSSSENYFHSDKFSKSLYGICLDGTEDSVRLDLYIYSMPGDGIGKPWIVDYCYIVE